MSAALALDTQLDLLVLGLLRKVRLAKAADLRFWTGRDPLPSLARLEEAEAIERVGPRDVAQHWRATTPPCDGLANTVATSGAGQFRAGFYPRAQGSEAFV